MPAPLAPKLELPARAGSNSTTTSTPRQPFFVPPKESASTPAFQVSSAGLDPSAATGLAKRAPSMCTGSPAAWATPVSAATAPGS